MSYLITDLDELLPCPFCGSQNITLFREISYMDKGTTYSIHCLDCKCKSGSIFLYHGKENVKDFQKIRDLWNNRVN